MGEQAHTALDALADYFTGPCVAVHSMGLSVGGMHKVAAERFFAARDAFGVSGYMSAEAARAAIQRATGGE